MTHLTLGKNLVHSVARNLMRFVLVWKNNAINYARGIDFNSTLSGRVLAGGPEKTIVNWELGAIGNL
jgi:hypothetical protein